MQPVRREMEVKASVAIGAEIDVLDLTEKAVQFDGTFSATLQLQGTINGTNFFDIGSAVTSPGVVEVAYRVKALRVKTTGFVSGTPVVMLAGAHSRTV